MANHELDEVTSSALGLAAFHLQNAILTTLVAKGHLTMKEAALTISGAAHALDELRPTPIALEFVALARQALSNLADGWQKQAKGN